MLQTEVLGLGDFLLEAIVLAFKYEGPILTRKSVHNDVRIITQFPVQRGWKKAQMMCLRSTGQSYI